MRAKLINSALGCGLLACALQNSSAREPPEIIRRLSKQVRALELRLAEIELALQSLPEIPTGPNGGSWGYHSRPRWNSQQSENPVSLVLDLGRDHPVETIGLVPTSFAYGSGESSECGFPPGIIVEVSRDRDFSSGLVVADSGLAPITDPFPAIAAEVGGTDARFVRVTANQLWRNPNNDMEIFALGELMVFSGNRNIAPGKAVEATDSVEGKPLWSIDNIVDGQSGLGQAVASQRSPTNGYHSEIETGGTLEKWVQVDLGAVMPIDEVRILPARPSDWAESHGFGFPVRFRVEAADGAEFANPTVLRDCGNEPFANPGDNPLVIPLDEIEARFVRFTATQLWQREGDFVFALAEMQVFSAGENVATSSTVSASDSLSSGRWDLEYLVDGFGSQFRIEDDELGWLRGIVHRQKLTVEREDTQRRLDAEIGMVSTRLVWLSSVGGIGLLGCLVIVFRRERESRKRETDRLRERIASDLHDEIGSNLGSIALLSEIGTDGADFAEINRVARETAESMQDIAWVIRSGHDSLEDLILRMREVAASMLKQVEYTFITRPKSIPDHKDHHHGQRGICGPRRPRNVGSR